MQLQINGGGAPTRSGEPVDASVLTGLGGLPLATRQQLDAAVILVARSASTAIGTTEMPLPPPSTPVPWLLPIACVPVQPTVVEIPPPVVSALTMPAATSAPLAPPSRDPAWWQYSATPQPRPAQRTFVVPPPPAPAPAPVPTPQQLQAAEGKRMYEEALKEVKADGKISFKETLRLQRVKTRPEVIEYRRMEAQSFKQNYIPSDGGSTPREITRSDALRELYKYADFLPKKTSLESLQAIVDGTSMGKRPPQLVAAARYMLDHPQEWKELTGKEGGQGIKRAGLCDALSRNIQFSASQLKTIETLEKNADDFFDRRVFGREKLDKIIADPKSKPENVEAAKQLLNDPVLFGMLDNTEYGHKSTGMRESDDGLIGRNDLRRFLDRVNRTPAPEPADLPRAPGPAPDPEAVAAMLKSQDEEVIKTVKGGAGKKVLNGVMKGFGMVAKIGSKALGAIAALRIPGLSQLAGLGSMATNAIAGGLDVARAALNGGNVGREAASAGYSFLSNVIGMFSPAGAGKIFADPLKEAGKAAAKEAGSQFAKEVGGQIIKDRLP